MSLINISTRLIRQTFPCMRKRLILVYFMVMTIILGTAETTLYFFLIHILNQQVDHELLTLVEVASPSLDTIETRGLEDFERQLPRRNLFSQQQQSLEWYDAQGELLAKEGSLLADLPLSLEQVKESNNFPLFQQQEHVRAVTISVYSSDPSSTDLTLKGYVRASESTKSIEATFHKLRMGLSLGGSTAIILISISSVYLTQQAIKPLKQMFMQLGDFTSDISHQLRTPLTRISMATEILLTHKEAIKPSDARKLTIINSATDQMKRLIEDLLFILRSDSFAACTQLRASKISLSQLLQVLAAEFEPIFQAKAINFQVKLLNHISIRGDAAKLNRLFGNLLENALNYTESGGTVSLSLEKHKCNVLICIRDTGMGIPSEDMSSVFQSFWRSEIAKQNRRDGFGLGLTIAQTIAKQHGGDISVKSQVGVGSLFRVYIPTN